LPRQDGRGCGGLLISIVPLQYRPNLQRKGLINKTTTAKNV
jgi:hypothetical protein